MIIQPDKPEAPSSSDAGSTIFMDDLPPAYSDPVGQAWPRGPGQEKAGTLGVSAPPSPVPSPTGEGSNPDGAAAASAPVAGSRFRNAAAWFTFGALSRTDREVKATVLGLIRDVVKQPSSAASVSILQSCAEACRARGLPFDQIVQERSIEGHTPLYWAILKRENTSEPPTEREIGVLDVLLSFELKPSCRSDACEACTVQSDNFLYQWLVNSPGWGKDDIGAEMMLLGERPKDTVIVEHDPDAADTGAFRMIAHVDAFQKRLRVRKKIRLEFVARERMWALTFHRDSDECPQVYGSEGAVAVLSLMEHSPRTPFKGRVVIKGAKRGSREPTVAPVTMMFTTSGSQRYLEAQTRHSQSGLVSKLDDVAGGASLQYDGSSYVNEDGSVDLTLEGVLTTKKVDPDCVIM